MIPISKQIINNKQKRAALVGCTLFCVYRGHGCYVFSMESSR